MEKFTKKFEKLQTEYIAAMTGAEYHPDIKRIPVGTSGDYSVKDEINIDGNYLYQSF